MVAGRDGVGDGGGGAAVQRRDGPAAAGVRAAGAAPARDILTIFPRLLATVLAAEQLTTRPSRSSQRTSRALLMFSFSFRGRVADALRADTIHSESERAAGDCGRARGVPSGRGAPVAAPEHGIVRDSLAVIASHEYRIPRTANYHPLVHGTDSFVMFSVVQHALLLVACFIILCSVRGPFELYTIDFVSVSCLSQRAGLTDVAMTSMSRFFGGNAPTLFGCH